MTTRFRLPLLNILDSMKDPENPERSLLDRVIYFLYVEENTSAHAVAAMLGMSEATVYERVPKAEKRRYKTKVEKEQLRTKVLRMKNEGKAPKEIAYELDISLPKVYAALRKSL